MEKIQEKIPLLIEIQCFGNVFFWAHVVKNQQVFFEQHEHFQKSGYRNRYHVLGANGVLTLSVPVVGGREIRGFTKDVQIDNSQNWQKDHWKTLESCYNKSPFFYHYAPGLQPLYRQNFVRLWDFNLMAFAWTVNQLKCPVSHHFSESYQKNPLPGTFVDLRGKFKTSGRTDFNHSAYFQVFPVAFQQNLSILDILFNLGPESSSYLYRQMTI